MFGGGWSGGHGGGRRGRGNTHTIDKNAVSAWRVCAGSRCLPVSADVEGTDIICDLEPRTRLDVIIQQVLPSGEVRACIIDPVWKCWVTLKDRRAQVRCAMFKGRNLRVRESVGQGVHVPGATQRTVEWEEDATRALVIGLQNRSPSSEGCTHALFTLTVRHKAADGAVREACK